VKPTERNIEFALAAEREVVEKHNAPIEAENQTTQGRKSHRGSESKAEA
jgi:hypothetical protein